METETFIARTAREALEQIRARLGTKAKVLKVRKVPRKGLSGLLGGAQVEVIVEKPQLDRPDASNHLALIKQELARRQPAPEAPRPRFVPPPEETPKPPVADHTPQLETTLLKSLDGLGLSTLYQHRLLDMLKRDNPDWLSEGLPAALQGIAAILEDGWRPAKPLAALGQRHLFIGPAGVGKSSLLSRRIVRAHLDEPNTGFVAALDGTTANSCPLLQYQCEALGVGFERCIPGSSQVGDASLYYDTPGVDWLDSSAIEYWRARLDELGNPSVHLVLNAAYDVALLTKQVRAFAPLGVADVSFTHLDEERNPSKLWNVILGSACLVRWLAGGQKVPGTLEEAEAISLLPPAMTSHR